MSRLLDWLPSRNTEALEAAKRARKLSQISEEQRLLFTGIAETQMETMEEHRIRNHFAERIQISLRGKEHD